MSGKSKTEAKPVKSKPKTTDKETQNQNASLVVSTEEESQNENEIQLPECTDNITKLDQSEMSVVQENAAVMSSPTPEIVPHEVAVGV